ncbi:alpha/beta hydrolase [Gemmobacter fulvus]|uniref:alpha/beta fold hydrolase n=1 Tax=Gemmobacter fulvus TaxID=2840474 RepID=UPI002796C5ED|nr:alpha/beta hydrolase [Gemmobacter fulvus]MDQ1847078.1 alpha/beta hydrolase [Gemmobacter fulvus]
MFTLSARQGLLALVLALATPAGADTPVPSQAEWDAARKTVTTADGQQLSYVEMGRAEGQPVLLLHGYTDNSRSWSLLAPHLAGRRLIALDLRGHGGSAAPACCYGIDSLAQDVDGFLAALNIDKADVIGHSLGSMTAATLAAYHPARVDQLVLVSTAASVPKAGSDWLWDNVPKLSHPIDPNSEFMLAWYWNPTPVAEDFLSRERAESAAVPAQVWMGVLKALTLTDWSPLAPRITAPTLVLWGDQDSLFDAASQTRVKELLPTARHETFTGLGHNFFWEQPEAAAQMINGFLAP